MPLLEFTSVPACVQLVRKLLIAVTAAATDPQLEDEAKPFAHHMARHLAMLLAVGDCLHRHAEQFTVSQQPFAG